MYIKKLVFFEIKTFCEFNYKYTFHIKYYMIHLKIDYFLNNFSKLINSRIM